MYIYIVQLVRELERIMGESVSTEIREIWEDLRLRIIALAKQEVGNHFIQDILSDLPEELPDG